MNLWVFFIPVSFLKWNTIGQETKAAFDNLAKFYCEINEYKIRHEVVGQCSFDLNQPERNKRLKNGFCPPEALWFSIKING